MLIYFIVDLFTEVAVNGLYSIASFGRNIKNDSLKSMWKEMFVSKFKVVCVCGVGDIPGNAEKTGSPVIKTDIGTTLITRSSRIRSREAVPLLTTHSI